MAKARWFLTICVFISIGFAACFDFYAYAQNRQPNVEVLESRVNANSRQLSSMDDRLEKLRDQVEDQARSIERRLTAQETLAESNSTWLRGIGVAIFLM